jgi:AraC-like DNA-binding protein
MVQRNHEKPSAIEREAIEKIRRRRDARRDGSAHSELEERAEMIYDILRGYQGNVKLRLEVISKALGSSMRTLEREFVAKYSETMNTLHEKIRLEHAERLLTSNPDIKLMSIAAELGYDRESEFNRFFRRKKGMSLTEYVNGIRAGQRQGGPSSHTMED